MAGQNHQSIPPEVTDLVSAFARELLRLNAGGAIPRSWKNLLLRAIAPPAGRRGRRLDEASKRALIRDVVLASKKLAGPKTKANMGLRGTEKQRLAELHSVLPRTVDRAINAYRRYPNLDANWKRVVGLGITDALSSNLDAAWERRRQERIRQASALLVDATRHK